MKDLMVATAPRYPSLDGIRGLAAMIVLVSHISNVTNIAGNVLGNGTGQLGVMLFFCLSGFLMGKLYLSSAVTRDSLGHFVRRRASRVLPLYLVLVLVSYGLGKVFGDGWPFYGIDDRGLVDHLLFVKGVDVLWTIPVEIQFYAAFTLLWTALSRVRAPLILAIGFLLASVVATLLIPGPIFLRSLPFFLSGMVVSLTKTRPLPACAPLVACGLALILLAPNIRPFIGLAAVPIDRIWQEPAYLLLVPAILYLSVRCAGASVVLGEGFLALLGVISYSIYLLHMPVIRGVRYVLGPGASLWIFIPICLLGILSVSTLSYFVFERPVARFLSAQRKSHR